MPTYEYVCQKCGHQFEQFQSMNAAPLKECPKCHKKALKRLVGSGAGLIFKGSGFYITDYKKTASPKDSGGGGEAKSVGETKSGGDAKPAGGAKSASPSAGTGTSSGATSGGSPSNSSTPKSPPAKK